MKKLYRKTYGVYKFTAYSAVIPYGDNQLRVNFRNGNVNVLRGTEPATYSTDKESYQNAIEASANFKKGKIKLLSKVLIGTVPDETEEVAETAEEGTVEAEEASAAATASYPEVKNTQSARAILMAEPYEIALSELGNKAAILARAAEVGAVFPNWK